MIMALACRTETRTPLFDFSFGTGELECIYILRLFRIVTLDFKSSIVKLFSVQITAAGKDRNRGKRRHCRSTLNMRAINFNHLVQESISAIHSPDYVTVNGGSIWRRIGHGPRDPPRTHRCGYSQIGNPPHRALTSIFLRLPQQQSCIGLSPPTRLSVVKMSKKKSKQNQAQNGNNSQSQAGKKPVDPLRQLRNNIRSVVRDMYNGENYVDKEKILARFLKKFPDQRDFITTVVDE